MDQEVSRPPWRTLVSPSLRRAGDVLGCGHPLLREGRIKGKEKGAEGRDAECPPGVGWARAGPWTGVFSSNSLSPLVSWGLLSHFTDESQRPLTWPSAHVYKVSRHGSESRPKLHCCCFSQ